MLIGKQDGKTRNKRKVNMSDKREIIWNNTIVEVEFDYTPFYEGSTENGMKMEPDTPEEAYIIEIRYNGTIVTPLFSELDFEIVEETILHNLSLEDCGDYHI